MEVKYMEKVFFRIQKTENLNEIYCDEPSIGGASHVYQIVRAGQEPLCTIEFQKGPRNLEESIAGVSEEDLLEIVRHRLHSFNKGEYACRENACALTHIEEALMWLSKRKLDRAEAGTLGTMKK